MSESVQNSDHVLRNEETETSALKSKFLEMGNILTGNQVSSSFNTNQTGVFSKLTNRFLKTNSSTETEISNNFLNKSCKYDQAIVARLTDFKNPQAELMTNQKCKVTYRGEIVPSESLDQVKQKLAEYFGFEPRKLDKYFKGETLTIKNNIDYKSAKQLQAELRLQGAICNIESLENRSSNPGKISNRDLFLQQGAQLIQLELDQQADFCVQLQHDIELRNTDLLSTSIIANKKIHNNIKLKIQEYSQNVQKILFAAAGFIEQEKFITVDDAIQSINLSKFDKNRLINLVNAQKNLSFSYSTLSAVIEIFRIANQNILTDLAKSGFADSTEKRLNKTVLYLKNAIIIYELTNFVVNYLSGFDLNGIEDIKQIQKEVYQDIEKNRLSDEELAKRVGNASDGVRRMTLQDIEQRKILSEKVKEKWEIMLHQINSQIQAVGNTKSFVEDLKLIRDNAKNRIDILNIAATTTLVENSMNMVTELASNMQAWALPPLDEKMACELLGLEVA